LAKKPEETRPLGSPGIHDVTIKMGLNEVVLEVMEGFIWLRMGISGGLYCTRQWTPGFITC